MLSGGYLAVLDCTQIATYCTLCLVADRHGISFYRPESLARIVKRPGTDVANALDALVRRGLIVCDGRYVQVLDLDDVEKGIARVNAPAGATPSASLVSPEVIEPVGQPPEEILASLAPAEKERLLQQARQCFELFGAKRTPSPGALAAAAVGILRHEEALPRRKP